ncbi:MAG: Hsp20/alpha crystallin family protein [Myxococcota bacterium]
MSLARRREAMTGWSPFRELEQMMERMGHLFPRGEGEREQLALADWAPSVNIREDEGAYVIEAELPRVSRDDVKVSVEEGVLTIEGERKLRKEEGEKGSRYHRVETAFGSFMRRFALPEDAAEEKVDASFKDGVLEVTIPKSSEKKPRARQVEVK